MATWRIDILNMAGSVVLSDLDIEGGAFSYVLNSPGALELDLALTNSQVTRANLEPGGREARVYRDNVLVWGGYVWGLSVELRNQVRLRAEGYFSRLRRRLVMSDLIYNDVAQQTIAWNLINHTQGQTNGDLGITQGSHSGSTHTREEAYCRLDHENIGEAIDAFTDLDDGLDFEITPTPDTSTPKVFKTWSPRKGTDRTGTITLSQANLMELTYDLSADDLISQFLMVGGGDCQPPEDTREDATAMSNYKLLQDYESSDRTKLKNMQPHAKEVLRNRKQPRNTAQVTWNEGSGARAWGAFVVGDLVTLDSTWGPTGGLGDFTTAMRVIELQVYLQQPNQVFYRAMLDSVTS